MDDETLANGIESYLSSRAGADVSIRRMQRPTATGFSADTVVLDVEGLADATRLVMQATPVGPSLFDDYDLERTFRVQQELAALGVPVAPMRWLSTDESWIGRPFYVMDYVPGRVPPDRPPYNVAGWLYDSSADVRERVWFAGIRAMAKLHAVPTETFAFLEEDPAQDPVDRNLRHWKHFAVDLGADAEPAFEAALDRLEQWRPAAGEPRVHWGDAKLANMMFDGTNVAAILDWELCGLSVGEEDLAHWMAVDWFLSIGLGNPRLGGLPTPAETIAVYEAAAGRPTDAVEWWFAFALVRMGLVIQRSAIQHRARKGDDRPLRPNALLPYLEAILDGSAWSRLQQS